MESYLKSSIISVHGAEHPRLGRGIVNLHRGPLVRVHLLLLGERAVQRLLSGDGLDAFDAAVPAHPLDPISVEEHLISLLLDRVLLVASLHPVWIKRRGRNGTSVSVRLLARGVSSRSPVSVFFGDFPGASRGREGWRGREWKNPKGEIKYFNSIQGWRIEKLNQEVDSSQLPPAAPLQSFETTTDVNDEEHDDLPF